MTIQGVGGLLHWGICVEYSEVWTVETKSEQKKLYDIIQIFFVHFCNSGVSSCHFGKGKSYLQSWHRLCSCVLFIEWIRVQEESSPT